MLPPARGRHATLEDMRFDLGGRVSLELVGPGYAAGGYVRRQLAPFEPVAGDGRPPDVTLVAGARDATPFREAQHAANDDLVTGTDGERFSVEWDARRCTIPDVFDADPARFEYEPGFPLWRVFARAVRPALQVRMAVAGRAVAIHAASVTVDGGAILVAGWSESGKTETALGLMERGAAFLSDKWTLAGPDGQASLFPITVGVRRWVLHYLPTLRASLTSGARVQFGLARGASTVLESAARRRARTRSAGLLVDVARKASALGDRAAFGIDELRAAYGQADDPTRRVPIRLVALLETVRRDEVAAVPADPGAAASRLARSATYERRPYLELLQRAGYLLPVRPATRVEQAIEADAALLRDLFARTPLVTIRAPFPTDPRRVADEILGALARA